MNRKEFLQRSAQLGLCCFAGLAAGSLQAKAGDSAQANTPVTPCGDRVKQGQDVIRRIISQLDDVLDEQTREKIIQNCGRGCYSSGNGPRKAAPPTSEEVEKFLAGMRNYLGADGVQQNGAETIVYFKYTGNPGGLKTSDGYCLCPILEDAPKNMSPTYCHCSLGYVRELFERGLGKPVTAQLTESVLQGGKTCRFTIRFKT